MTPEIFGPRIVCTPANEEKFYITSVAKYLSFSNDKSRILDIYWVEARIISRLKPTDLK